MQKFGLLRFLLPCAQRIREIRGCYNGRVFGTSETEQYGMYYCDLVNCLRSQFPPGVRFKHERVVEIRNSEEFQVVKLSGGEELACRLVVLACGLSADLLSTLKFRRSWIQRHQSVALGFTIARKDSQRFPFDSVTYYAISPKLGVDYISLFPARREVRANLFAFPEHNDSWVREFILEPNNGLRRCFPKLHMAIGDNRVTSKVDAAVVHLYKGQDEPPAGVVLIGDAAQNVCPATGMGLNKIFTDVDVLSRCIPQWLSSNGMSTDKLGSFYNHSEKRAVDIKAIRNAFYRRHAATGRSLKWKIHRARLHFTMQFRRPTQMDPSRS